MLWPPCRRYKPIAVRLQEAKSREFGRLGRNFVVDAVNGEGGGNVMLIRDAMMLVIAFAILLELTSDVDVIGDDFGMGSLQTKPLRAFSPLFCSEIIGLHGSTPSKERN